MEIDVACLKNHLGIFAEGFEKVNIEKIIDLVSGFVTISDLSGILKASFVAETILVEKCIREKLLALVFVTDRIYELFNENLMKMRDWLMNPNPLFFDFSPFQLVLGGKAEVVIGKIEEWV